jgi:hypothetical protein
MVPQGRRVVCHSYEEERVAYHSYEEEDTCI